MPYKNLLNPIKKINGYEHKLSDISSCNVSVLDESRTKNIKIDKEQTKSR